MFKKIILFAMLSFSTTSLLAQENIITLDPQRRAPTLQADIKEPNIEITPEGAYARIDLTFRIAAQNKSSYKTTDTLEAVLNFDLPVGSFIHDSWLWLDDTHIIRADVVEKNRAITIYEGIVNRRRDPSLLIKTGANSYKLNVFPLTTGYPRKIKISYSVPFNWYEKTAKLPLPTKLIRASANLPDIIVRVDKNPLFLSPSFIGLDYNQRYLGVSGTKDLLMIYSSDYQQKDITLQYNTQLSNGISFTNFATGNSEGYFQLTVPPSAIGKEQIRNVTVVLDHTNNQSIYTQQQIIDVLKESLLADYNSTDSFNLFYSDNNKIVQAFTSWQPINKANIDQSFNAIPSGINTPSSLYQALLEEGIKFCNNKNVNAEILLVGNSSAYTKHQASTDQFFDDIKKNVGSFNNKINVLNYSSYRTYGSGKYLYANDLLYSKLTLVSGGVIYKYVNRTYSWQNGKYTYSYDLNAANALAEIASNFGEATSKYSIDVDFNVAGFTHSEYNISNTNKIYFSRNNTIIGRYYGDLTNGVNVHIKAITQNGNIDTTFSINNVLAGSPTMVKEWTHKYIMDLLGQNNPSYVQEIIDSSINNRVLCDVTAFLAVETGDTIATNIDNNPNVPTSTETIKKDSKAQIKAYPNPFSGNITIELPENAKTIKIYDITGKEVYSKQMTSGQKQLVWNGLNSRGQTLSAGVYLIIIQTDSDRHVLRVIKQ